MKLHMSWPFLRSIGNSDSGMILKWQKHYSVFLKEVPYSRS